MGTLDVVTTLKPVVPSTPTERRVLLSAARYLVGKALTILVTIFMGVFVTLLIANYPGGVGGAPGLSPFEARLESQIHTVIQISMNKGIIHRDQRYFPIQSEVDALEQKLRSEAGMNLPFLPRYLLWTYKALTFDWGELNSDYFPQLGIGQGLRNRPTSNPVLQYLPNTLLLVGTAYLLVFLIGMPFSLYLARHYGGWPDRVLSVLSPISSVPSWVFAILLVTVFAVQLHWLPVAGMFDFHKPTEPLPYILALLRHMALPVSALVLSLLFQLVYTWRTFFILYSEEDYVDLARAKGLDTNLLEKRYILQPALPYVITSFTASLIGFWQLTVALEKIFQWPGIGLLYIEALPSYWKDAMEVGDLMIVIQIVVTFSYLLGILAFVLDLAYVIVDPRIHLVPSSHPTKTNARIKTRHRSWDSVFAWMKEKASGPDRRRVFSPGRSVRNLRESLRDIRERIRLFIEQLRMYPSAMFGLAVIALLLAGSLYALIALPYEEIGMDYDQVRVSGRNLAPRTAAPTWLNLFSRPPYLSTLILDENSRETHVMTETLENGWVQKTTTLEFDYRYREVPSDVFLYLESRYDEKIPFISLEWMTPDGRTIDLKAKAMGGEKNYDLQTGTFIRPLLVQHPEWKNWFVEDGQHPTPAYKLLFAKPASKELVLQHGTYQLKITSLLFEKGSDVQAQLVVLGQVYGLAGTDYWRRELTVPLFWGMPFTLIVGFLGTFITILVAMLLPAIGVWFGGWLDNLIQRLSEVNMVLPGLAIAVLVNALFGVHIWIILGIVVVLNGFGAPIKSFRSVFLQAKEAPYIEMARSYGASNFRIISRYLVPRIFPVLIPYLVMQIPIFIFLEATLGFFNIRSVYPTWGRIIYEGLAHGVLYGSPFWVLEPIFLLLLTGLAFAMLGLALERILNPRLISDIPDVSRKPEPEAGNPEGHRRVTPQPDHHRKVLAGLLVAALAIFLFIPSLQGKTFASVFMSYLDPFRKTGTGIKDSDTILTKTPESVSTTSLVEVPVTPTQPSSTPTPTLTLSPTLTAALTQIATESTPTLTPTEPRPVAYALQKGEYPYCIARRFNVDPGELLVLNGMLNRNTFYAGTVLQIPQTGKPFPGERRQNAHPAMYTVASANETIFTIACQFGDVDPLVIAQANEIAIDSALYAGQQLNIP